MGYRETRSWVHGLFKVGAGGRTGGHIDHLIMGLIVLNVIAVMLETVDSLYASYATKFLWFEAISVAIFSIEYISRLWAATEHPDYQHPIWGRLRYAFSPYMIIDLLAILPFFFGAILDLRFLRALRLLRFLRLFKLARYSESIQLFVRVLQLKREELVITSVVGTIILLMSSSLMYFAERGAQPEEFSSIPASLWWGVITLTTVGYGDVTPVTPIGQVLGAVIAVTGIGLFALPASILASGFIEAARGKIDQCPHCGQEILEEDLEKILESD
ncbi:ion transporter [Natronococcus amylolyticus]|nr:ion transporter [Natronococcus amylolyticus]